MASLSHDRAERWRVQFVAGDGRRPTLYVRGPQEKAEAVRRHVGRLAACRDHPDAVPEETLQWVLTLDAGDYDKLAAAGLLPPRDRTTPAAPTVGRLLDDVAGELAGLKPNTQEFYRVVGVMAREWFAADPPVAAVTAKDADACVAWMRGRLGPATVARRIKALRKIFGRARRWEWIQENPFDGIKAGLSINAARQAYVPLEVFEKLLAEMPDLEFRCVLALSRLGALRTPSEVRLLRWGDVRWEERKLIIRSPKTEAHEGGASREMPLFPRLYEILLAWHAEAPPGEYVIGTSRGPNKNWRSRLTRLLERCGVAAWPKLFHNLRASRESELVERYPLATVCRWLGHRPEVAARHYLMVTDHDQSFQDAAGLLGEAGGEAGGGIAQKAAHVRRTVGCLAGTGPGGEPPKTQEISGSGGDEGPPERAQQDSNLPQNSQEIQGGGGGDSRKSSAREPRGHVNTGDGPRDRWQELAKVWGRLTPAVQESIVGLARSAAAARRDGGS